MQYQETINKLSNLNFDGKGENFVEARFLTPLYKRNT